MVEISASVRRYMQTKAITIFEIVYSNNIKIKIAAVWPKGLRAICEQKKVTSFTPTAEKPVQRE